PRARGVRAARARATCWRRSRGGASARATSRAARARRRRARAPEPRVVLGVEEAVELRVAHVTEQRAELRVVVEALRRAAGHQRGQPLGREAPREVGRLLSTPERLEPGGVPRGEQLVVPLEVTQRLTPVEQDGLKHYAVTVVPSARGTSSIARSTSSSEMSRC